MTEEVVCDGKYVAITYTIVDESGQVVEQRDQPVGYVHGGDTQLMGDMDKAVHGRRVGDQVELSIPADQAFGHRDPSLVIVDDIENVPPDYHRLGAEVAMHNEHGQGRIFYVTGLDDDTVTLDGNHPLAGHDLQVTVTIHEIRDAKPGEDMTSGIHAVKMPAPTTLN